MAWFVSLFLVISLGCQEAVEPANVRTAVFTGSPYERGLQHGQMFGDDIRSLYTRLLTNSLVPMLNQEQMGIAPILRHYFDDAYMDGHFTEAMLYESAAHMIESGLIPAEYVDEMRGISDGSGIPLWQIEVLNTFVDTMLAFQAVVAFIRQIRKPHVTSVQFVSNNIVTDSVDNDGDGTVDESDEGLFDPFEPFTTALAVELPTNTTVRFVITDVVLEGQTCVDPENIDPMTFWGINRSCVKDHCLDGCWTEDKPKPDFCSPLPDPVPPECLCDALRHCLEPKVHVSCFDPACLHDEDPGCVNPATVRVLYDGQVFTWNDPEMVVQFVDDPSVDASVCDVPKRPVEVLFTPSAGFPTGSAVSVTIGALDQAVIYAPAPVHAQSMRDERITFTTAGHADSTGIGVDPKLVLNTGKLDGASQPTALAFAVRDSATIDHNPLAVHHYALVDGDIVHEHSLVSTIIPLPGEGIPHVILGWTGLVWGFSGMNADGLVFAINHSDTLDNPLIGGILDAILYGEGSLEKLLNDPTLSGLGEVLAEVRLYASGTPIGIVSRQALSHDTTADSALDRVFHSKRTFGWNIMLVDAAGDSITVETDSAILGGPAPTDDDPVKQGDGFWYARAGEDIGQTMASVGSDDIRMCVHYRMNAEDMLYLPLDAFTPECQDVWTGTWYRSLRTDGYLEKAISERYGNFDLTALLEVLLIPELVDARDSMSAAIFEPAKGIIHWAMGQVPAIDGVFETIDLSTARALQEGL